MRKQFTFILDIDGTLTTFNRDHLTEEDKSQILREQEKGNRVLPATGRSIHEMKNIFDEKVFTDDLMLLSNGLLTIKGDDIIKCYSLDLQQSRDVIKKAIELGLGDTVSVVTVGLKDGKVCERLEAANAYKPVEGEYIMNIWARPDISKKNELIELLKPVVGDQLVVKDSGEYLEIASKFWNKGTILEELYQQHLFGDGTIVYVGDSENDIQAMKFAQSHGGYGIAMGNALDSVKRVADYVTADVNHGGVAQAMRWAEEQQ